MNDDKKLFQDFIRALAKLEEVLSIPANTDREKAGCIKFFEFTFELAWKTMKAFAENQGLECHSPKAAIKSGYELNFFDDENIWLEMLKARNLMSHTYDEQKSLAVYNSLDSFLVEFVKFKSKFQSS